MKRIEVYLDESGEIRGSGRPMNVTGIVTVAADGRASDEFHRSLYRKLSGGGLLAGICDGGPAKIIHTNSPRDYLPKRPKNGDVAEHRRKVLDMLAYANQAAADTGVELGAFSLVFPCNAKMPWRSLTAWEDQLLDRSYLERLKDALELLFFECPWLLARLSGPCELAVDLPTRSVTADLLPQLDLKRCGEILRGCWGMKNDGEAKGELRACSLAPADGAEILTSVLARRHRSLPGSVTILGARCVRLMDWESWDRDCPNAGARNNWDQKYLAPKQVHYLADLLANSVYHENSGSVLHKDNDVLAWYGRGYFLKAGEVDPWIIASRMFANGDRVGALRMLIKDKVAMACGGQADFFRSRSKDWFPQLGGADLQNLFAATRSTTRRHKRLQNLNARKSPSRPTASPERTKPEVLNLLTEPRTKVPDGQSVSVRWRALLELPSSWTTQSLMEAARAAENLPEPLGIRAFSKDDTIEFLLDLRSEEDVRAWIASPVVLGGEVVMALDATLPRSHRIVTSSLDESEQAGIEMSG